MEYTQILTLLRRIIRSVNLESKRIEKAYGLSLPQLLCLSYLHTQPNYQASQKAIKDYLSLNASTVTGIINRLEKKGFVAKMSRRDDRRISQIALTARGADVMRDLPTPFQDRLSGKLQQLDEEEVKTLRRAFDLLARILDGENERNAESGGPNPAGGSSPENEEIWPQ